MTERTESIERVSKIIAEEINNVNSLQTELDLYSRLEGAIGGGGSDPEAFEGAIGGGGSDPEAFGFSCGRGCRDTFGLSCGSRCQALLPLTDEARKTRFAIDVLGEKLTDSDMDLIHENFKEVHEKAIDMLDPNNRG